MAHYWGKFVPSVHEGLPAMGWEHFRNAEVPARTLKTRAKERWGKTFYPGDEKVRPVPVEVFENADQSAMYLIWLSRDEPAPDKAPDECWHLTNHWGLIRTPWSVIMEEANEGEDDTESPHEPAITGKIAPDEESVIDLDTVLPREVWQPPGIEELAERKVILIGDKRPLTAGAYSERRVERPNLRRACERCGVVPSPFTLDCRC